MHVLVIEDEAPMGLDLTLFFTELGADSCDLAATEGEALKSARAHHPDLVTADIDLADGSGLAAVRSIREEIGEVPVVYLTASTEPVIAQDENTHVLRKPIRWLELVTTVRPHNLPLPLDLPGEDAETTP